MTIGDFDRMPPEKFKAQLYKCCGSNAWVEKMMSVLPFEDMIDLFQYAEEKWNECSEADWREAFAQHPQIGNTSDLKTGEDTESWAREEQAGVNDAGEDLKNKLANANKEYIEKFGYQFIINATGKSADELFTALEQRLQNSPEVEMDIAMSEQLGITRIRLEKLLQEG